LGGAGCVGEGYAGSLMAAEVMWTPEEEYDSLTPEQVNLDFPSLIPL
jgi:uncharacterized membrane protein